MSLVRRLRPRPESSEAQEARRQQVIEAQQRMTHMINRAAVAASDRWGEIVQQVQDMVKDRKDQIALLHPVQSMVEIAKAQGGIVALEELVKYFASADEEAKKLKQTVG